MLCTASIARRRLVGECDSDMMDMGRAKEKLFFSYKKGLYADNNNLLRLLMMFSEKKILYLKAFTQNIYQSEAHTLYQTEARSPREEEIGDGDHERIEGPFLCAALPRQYTLNL